MAHANARLTPAGRLLLCQRIAAGRPVAHVADQMGVSRTCAYRWWGRWQDQGMAGLQDRSSVAHTHPRRIPASVEAQIVRLRRDRKLGPARIGAILQLPASTVYRVLCRHQLHRLAVLDRPTGRLIRRYERARPGELVHLDVKKLGRLPDGGGHRAHGRDSVQHRTRPYRHGPGWEYVHSLVDDHSRLAYSQICDDEQATTCAQFLIQAAAFFAAHGITIQRVLTDNAKAYRISRTFAATIASLGAVQRFTRPYRPQTNGKVERFNRTLLEEWAYAQPYQSNSQRRAALDGWLHTYNYHRAHTALGGNPPISRINNAPEHYS